MMLTGGGSAGSVAEQQASHPCGSACQAHPPQTVSAAQFKRMQAADKRLEAQAAARERAAKAKAAAEARARAHESCGWADLSCDLHKAASAFDKARHTVAATADAAVRAASGAAGDVASDVIRPGWELVVRAARDEATAIADAAEYGIHAVGTAVSYAAQAGSRVYHAATRLADAAGRVAVSLVKTAYHGVKKAVTSAVAFVRHHAAVITSIVVGIAVFAGCEAVTAGVGSVGCAALAGAASNMASYAVTAAQSGRFSVGGLLLAGATGAVIGAATAGLLDGAGGLLSSGIDDAASSLADSAVSEATDETTGSASVATGDSAPEDGGDTAQRVFRADSRGPEEIFSRGFEPKGNNMDLVQHAWENPADSGYVSTSSRLASAQDFAEDNGYDYIYKLRASGVDVNAELGAESPFPFENEIAVPHPIPGGDIEGVWGPEGWFDNPGFAP